MVYLESMEVWDRENDGDVFLWLVSNIKKSVATSCVMGKCRTDVFVSVFCDVRDSIELPYDGEWLRDSAVSLLNPWKTSFYLVEESKEFKNNVWNVHSAPRKLCRCFIFKISNLQIYTMFVKLITHLFHFFQIFWILWQSGFPGVFAC